MRVRSGCVGPPRSAPPAAAFHHSEGVRRSSGRQALSQPPPGIVRPVPLSSASTPVAGTGLVPPLSPRTSPMGVPAATAPGHRPLPRAQRSSRRQIRRRSLVLSFARRSNRPPAYSPVQKSDAHPCPHPCKYYYTNGRTLFVTCQDGSRTAAASFPVALMYEVIGMFRNSGRGAREGRCAAACAALRPLPSGTTRRQGR